MDIRLKPIFDNVISGKKADVEGGVRDAIDAKVEPERILNEALISAMKEVGTRFENGEFYVPEMLVAAKAMQSGLAILRPHLVEQGVRSAGKVLMGTVKGDMHDIGKNLVAMMLEGAGYEIVDLGTDVSPEGFEAAIREHQPAIVGMSALLTTTMAKMKTTIKVIEDAGLRSQVKIIVGGAPLTDTYAKEIGADGYAPDASRAVTLAKSLT